MYARRTIIKGFLDNLRCAEEAQTNRRRDYMRLYDPYYCILIRDRPAASRRRYVVTCTSSIGFVFMKYKCIRAPIIAVYSIDAAQYKDSTFSVHMHVYIFPNVKSIIRRLGIEIPLTTTPPLHILRAYKWLFSHIVTCMLKVIHNYYL